MATMEAGVAAAQKEKRVGELVERNSGARHGPSAAKDVALAVLRDQRFHGHHDVNLAGIGFAPLHERATDRMLG